MCTPSALIHVRLPCARHLQVGEQDYSGFGEEAPPLRCGSVRVRMRQESAGAVTFVALMHPLFEQRTKETIYPDARRRYDFLTFFGLWNQSVAELLIRLRASGDVGLYHCLDYHTSLAPWYIRAWGQPPIPMAVTLHNALYQVRRRDQTLRPDTATDAMRA